MVKIKEAVSQMQSPQQKALWSEIRGTCLGNLLRWEEKHPGRVALNVD